MTSKKTPRKRPEHSVCPRCAKGGFTSHTDQTLDGRPRFKCEYCKNTWTCGKTGGPWMKHAFRILTPTDLPIEPCWDFQGLESTMENLMSQLKCDRYTSRCFLIPVTLAGGRCMKVRVVRDKDQVEDSSVVVGCKPDAKRFR